ncbi:Telomeric repeat-binding factor 2-interacting 1 protein [Rutstroemia sp. NJR-2017a BVV2]|nr:Telomeric repeat-binding factor 2-interacting 1 protein [Rutstroemia sp. NJR-2017a BVV2]
MVDHEVSTHNMSVSIVYEGVGGGGDLFANLKFFLVQRIPSRGHYIELIKSNGGEITKLEKMADIIIADHARKDVPAGSISWKFIDESVKAGELKDIEDYRCGASANSSRPRRSNQPNKSSRNPFTQQEDHILTQWVTKAARRGLATKGNDIYIQLEELYPQHTAQSWRDRWVKQLLPRRPGDYPLEEPDDTSIPNPQPPQKKGAVGGISLPRQRVSSSAIEPKTSRSYSATSSKRPVSPIKPKESERGMAFTEEDAACLRNEFQDILEVREDKEIDAWAAWARTHPRHTAQEWRNYFHEDFKLRELEKLQAKIVKKPAPPSKNNRVRSPPRLDTSKKSKGPEPTPELKPPKTNKDSNRKQSDVRPVTPPQKAEKRTVADPRTPDDKQRKVEVTNLVQEALQLLLDHEDHFETALTDFFGYLQSDEDDINLEFSPTICESKVSLFELWKSVMSHGGFGGVDEKALWPTIADRLHYPLAWHARAADALRDCYEELLFGFEEAVTMQADDPDTMELSPSQEDALLQDQPLDTFRRKAAESFIDDEATYEDDLDQPSSAIRLPAKRSTADKKRELLSDDEEPDRKRAKNNKGKAPAVMEIPSTPESIFNGTRKSPRKYQVSPLKNAHVNNQSDNDSNAEEELPEFPRPSLPSWRDSDAGPSFSRIEAQKSLLEPETQDFHFPDLDTIVVPSSPPTRAPRQPSPILDSTLHDDSSTQSQPESENDVEVYEFIDSRVALGYPEDIVIEALVATTMETGDATVVMESLRNGDPIPDNMAGVWTKEDDKALENDDEQGKEFRRVLEKHGEWRVEQRRNFLEDNREVAELD